MFSARVVPCADLVTAIRGRYQHGATLVGLETCYWVCESGSRLPINSMLLVHPSDPSRGIANDRSIRNLALSARPAIKLAHGVALGKKYLSVQNY